MNKKSLVKFHYDSQVGLFHYVIYNKSFVVLSEKDTGKIEYIKKHGTLDVTFDVIQNNYDVLDVEIIDDPAYVKEVYDYMIQTNNPYFKDGTDNLVALKFSKEKA